MVAQHLSFARAAEVLLITPSGLSVLIREFERQLCFRVFNRTTRQVTLTAEGRELLAVTRPAVTSLDAAMLRIEKANKGKARQISLGATPWIAANVIPPALREFREVRPELQIRIFDGTLDAIARRVQAGKLDLAAINRPILVRPDHHEGKAERRYSGDNPVVVSERSDSDLTYDELSAPAVDRQRIGKSEGHLPFW